MNKKPFGMLLLFAAVAALVFYALTFVFKKTPDAAEAPATAASAPLTVEAAPATPIGSGASSAPSGTPGEAPSAPDTSAAVMAEAQNLTSQYVTPSESAAFRILLSKEIDSHSFHYTVQPGDSLYKIAKRHNTTVDLIKKANNLPDDRIYPEQKLKITKYRFSIVVDKSQNILLLKGDDEVLKTYVVSTGKPGHPTPVGVFKVTDKLVDPTWYKTGAVVPADSPENILGTRWLGISERGYGIHGTTMPEELGQPVTAGCVRMHNRDVEELFTIVPSGVEVTIVS